MARIMGFAVVVVLMTLLGMEKPSAEGRWKIGSNGCYWDQYDSGPSQCGRWKVGGEAGCYWDPVDDGYNQCDPPASESALPNMIAASDQLSGIGDDTLEDAEAALNVAYSYGLVGSPPDDLSEAGYYAQNSGQQITCAKKAEILQKLNNTMYATGIASATLGAGAAASAFFVPPASAGLWVSSALMAALTAVVNYAYNQISNLSCT